MQRIYNYVTIYDIMDDIKNELKFLGLSDNEARIYLANLELGKASVLAISKQAEIKRPTAYITLNSLQEKGIVREINENNKSRYLPENPKIVIDRQKRKINELEKILPMLSGLFVKNEDKPKVRFYEGKEGIISIYEDNLLEPQNSELLAFTSAKDLYNLVGDYMDEHIERRVKRNISVKTIVTNYEEFPKHFYNQKPELRQMRALKNEDFSFNGEINIYGNKVSIVSLTKEVVGLIIESQQIANNMRAIFRLAWRGAQDLEQKNIK